MFVLFRNHLLLEQKAIIGAKQQYREISQQRLVQLTTPALLQLIRQLPPDVMFVCRKTLEKVRDKKSSTCKGWTFWSCGF